MKLYRAVSKNEIKDFELYRQLRTSKNTLEAKQFFKSKAAVLSFVTESRKQEFDPPYKYLLIIDIDEDYLNSPSITSLNLDGFDAISVEENELLAFSFYINFVIEENL